MPIDVANSFVISAVRAKAQKLKTHACFSDKDSEDIEEDLFVHLWETGLTLPPGQFVEIPLIYTILNRKGVDMLRAQMTKKELIRRDMKSLDVIVGEDEDGNPQTLANTLPALTPGVVDEAAFHVDLAERLSKLSDKLDTIVEKMQQGWSHADIAREMKLSRDAFHRRYATPIQKTIFPEWYAKPRKNRIETKVKKMP